MLEIIKRMDCYGYLLVNTNIPFVKPSKIPLRVRWRVKQDLKALGFIPFLTGWMIKPIHEKGGETILRKKIKSQSYELSVQVAFLFIRKEDFKHFEKMNLAIKEE